jgi:hypothetical protein
VGDRHVAPGGILVGGIVVLQAVLAPFTNENTIALAASTLVAATLFQPLRRRVQQAVDRRFDRLAGRRPWTRSPTTARSGRHDRGPGSLSSSDGASVAPVSLRLDRRETPMRRSRIAWTIDLNCSS